MPAFTPCRARRIARAGTRLAFALAFFGETPAARPPLGAPQPWPRAVPAPQSATHLPPERWRAVLDTVVATERAFSRASDERGTRDAFLEFLAGDALTFRPGPVKGKDALRAQPPSRGLLLWEPVWADLAGSGEIGYTTGPFVSRRTREDTAARHGHYVTLWKRQPDGRFRAVVDVGIGHQRIDPAPAFATRARDARPAPPGDRASLLEADRAIGAAGARALRDALMGDARVNRDGSAPATGEAARTLLAQWAGTVTAAPIDGDVARSGDFGYTWGSYTATRPNDAGSKEQGSYVRIWRRRPDGRWGIALDIVNPHPPGTPSP